MLGMSEALLPYSIQQLNVTLRFAEEQANLLRENWYVLCQKVIDEGRNAQLSPDAIGMGPAGPYALTSLGLLRRIGRFTIRTRPGEDETPAIWTNLGLITAALIQIPPERKLPSEWGVEHGVYVSTQLSVYEGERPTKVPVEFSTAQRLLLQACRTMLNKKLKVEASRELEVIVNKELAQIAFPKLQDVSTRVFGHQYSDAFVKAITLETEGLPLHTIHATKDGLIGERVKGEQFEADVSDIAGQIERDVNESLHRLKFDFIRLR